MTCFNCGQQMKLNHKSRLQRVPRRLERDVLREIENNGEVTLPGWQRRDSLITKRQLQFVLLIIGMLLARRRSR